MVKRMLVRPDKNLPNQGMYERMISIGEKKRYIPSV
jgi:hypothetical protein